MRHVLALLILLSAPAFAQSVPVLVCTDGVTTLNTCRTLKITGCSYSETSTQATYACGGTGGTVPVPASPGSLLAESAGGVYVEGPVCTSSQLYRGAGTATYTCVSNATTVNGVSCAVGAACTVTATPSGIVSPALGGTGQDSSALTGVAYDNAGTWGFDQQLYKGVGGGSDGQLMIGGTEGGSAWTLATLTQGTNITVTNGKGAITVGVTNNSTTVGGSSCALGSSCSPATTVNGTSCSLGGSCTITAAASSVACGALPALTGDATSSAGSCGTSVGKITATGASTASGTASFDLSGASGIFKTSTGAVTIGPGAIGVSGAETSNIGGTTAVPYTTVGVASQNGYVYTGTAPASVAGPATACGSMQSFTGATGGATTGSSTTGGAGEGEVHAMGAGGSGAGGTNTSGGAGGTFLVTVSAGGARSGAGSVGAAGTLTVKATNSSHGQTFQVQDSTSSSNFAVTDGGNVSTKASATYTSGLVTLIGAIADRLSAADLAIASQAVGDLLYADSTTTMARLPVGTAAQYLHGGTTPGYGAISSEFNFSAYGPTKAGGAIVYSQTTATNASTLTRADVTIGGLGSPHANSFTLKLCVDGSTCAGPSTYASVTLLCDVASGSVNGMTINSSAVAGGTVLTWNETASTCATDPGLNMNAHFTNP